MIEQLFSSPTCFATQTVVGPDKMMFVFLFLMVSCLSLIAVKKTSVTKFKIIGVYCHLLFLFLPLFLLSVNTSCGVMCLSCHNNLPALFLYSIPTAAAATGITSYFVMPAYFIRTHRKRKCADRAMLTYMRSQARRMGIPMPHLFIADQARPIAFSFRSFKSAIFLSVGMLDILTKKEIEAVILHELAHLKARSSALRISHVVFRVSPFSLLMKFHDQGAEEDAADQYAIRTQGTARHVRSAQRKLEAFHSERA